MILSYVFHQKMKIPILLKDKGNEIIIKLTYKFSLAEVKPTVKRNKNSQFIFTRLAIGPNGSKSPSQNFGESSHGQLNEQVLSSSVYSLLTVFGFR